MTEKEFSIIKGVYTSISKGNLKNLTHQRIRTIVKNQIPGTRVTQHRQRRLFTLLDAQWRIRFHPPSFGLNRIYFHFQLSRSSSLSKILGFSNPANTLLATTIVYQDGKFDNYRGIIVLPTQIIGSMEKYLKNCEDKGQIIIKELSKINDIQITHSLKLYVAEKGWRALKFAEYQNFLRNTKAQKEHTALSDNDLMLTSPFYTNWHFRQDSKYTKPTQFIELFCNALPAFSYDELLHKDPSKRKEFRFSDSEFRLLKYLHDKNVLQLTFEPLQLMADFSLQQFWIQPISSISQDVLFNLIRYLPVTHVISTEKTKYIWTRLTPQFVKLLNDDLNWDVTPLTIRYYGLTSQKSWYNQESEEWRRPLLLKNY
ncbi:MAG: hypothetical protein ACFE95_00210 [Candidatus Hodarchaeota archaeon]